MVEATLLMELAFRQEYLRIWDLLLIKTKIIIIHSGNFILRLEMIVNGQKKADLKY
jgi:hypothetical protein